MLWLKSYVKLLHIAFVVEICLDVPGDKITRGFYSIDYIGYEEYDRYWSH